MKAMELVTLTSFIICVWGLVVCLVFWAFFFFLNGGDNPFKNKEGGTGGQQKAWYYISLWMISSAGLQ